MTATRALTELAGHEAAFVDEGEVSAGHRRRRRERRPAATTTRRIWAVLLVAGIAWALWSAGLGRRPLVNPRGWSLFARFWAAAPHPELSGDFLRLTGRATLTTVAFAVVGTAASLVIGIVGGVLSSETWWRRSRPAPGRHTGRTRTGWFAGRALWSLPRGIHEAVWGIFFVSILGRDPLVGVLAIAIPFGAITAKVYAELVDEADHGPYDALRSAGSARLAALVYGLLPTTLPDMVSYAFYRLECSIRSAVILGIIGAGGLGFQLELSFQSLHYREMWTLIYALVAVSAVTDVWGAALRRAPTPRLVRRSALAGAVLVVAGAVHLHPHLGRLVGGETRSLLGDLVARSWPPTPPPDGWGGLFQRSIDTMGMSLLAIAIAAGIAVPVAFLAARRARHESRSAVASLARMLLLVTRAIPPPVWALLVLFVLVPGTLPGAVALGLYTAGVLGRLMAEVVENVDDRPGEALRMAGAGRLSVFAYATAPLSAARFVAYSLYRWEVAVRETVIVGVVGAGGLGLLLERQRSAFDYSGMAATVAALVVISLAVDLISATVRRSLR